MFETNIFLVSQTIHTATTKETVVQGQQKKPNVLWTTGAGNTVWAACCALSQRCHSLDPSLPAGGGASGHKGSVSLLVGTCKCMH